MLFIAILCYLQWLTDNIELDEKGVVLRSTLYNHYFEYCLNNKRTPPNQATFGKLVKHVFHGFVISRRLGARGCSMYCHAGIRFKSTSKLNHDAENEKTIGKRGRKSRGVLKELGIKVPPRPSSGCPPPHQQVIFIS